MDAMDWYSSTHRAIDVVKLVSYILEFSKGRYSKFFQNCGLYAVGSSLERENPNDIDIVLVGLDFRAVAEYDKVFLQDPETLIEKKIVITPELARKRGVISPLVFSIGQTGMESVWHPLPEAPKKQPQANRPGSGALQAEPLQQDRMEELPEHIQFMLMGIEHRGASWAFNYQMAMANSTAMTLDHYCQRQGKTSKLASALLDRACSAFGQDLSMSFASPFEPYFHEPEYYLTVRAQIHERKCPVWKKSSFDNCQCLPIDLMIHAENLHTKFWKEHQQTTRSPYLCLHEWEKAEEMSERPTITKLAQPQFIDPQGKERAKWHPYFSYLRTAPINVQCSRVLSKSEGTAGD
jgi:hypothetical protein